MEKTQTNKRWYTYISQLTQFMYIMPALLHPPNGHVNRFYDTKTGIGVQEDACYNKGSTFGVKNSLFLDDWAP